MLPKSRESPRRFDLSGRRRFRGLGLLALAVAIGSFGSPGSRGGTLHGQVWNADTGLGVDGAAVTLVGEGGSVTTARAVTTAFGFFTLEDSTGGTHNLVIRRAGFAPLTTPVHLPVTESRRMRFALQPLPDERFEVQVRVADVTSGLALGRVPVELARFESPDDPQPAEVLSEVTDRNGSAVFAAPRSGYYRFRANDPGHPESLRWWQPYSTEGTREDRRLLTQTHLASVALEPIPQSLLVETFGPDPVRETEGPLERVAVELAGLDPQDTNLVVIPTRSGITDSNGRLRFDGLPSLVWRVTARRYGYETVAAVLHPDAAGGLASTPLRCTLPLLPTGLQVALRSEDYQAGTNALFHQIPVRLEGVAGTGTEGLSRVLVPTPLMADAASREATNLLPGRYRITADGAAVTNPSVRVRPFFQGTEVLEIDAGRTHAAILNLTALPARVRGRLWIAEQLADFPAETGRREPVYAPRGNEDLEWAEYERDRLTAPARRRARVATDPTGRFAATLLPTRYGLKVAGLTNYWGSHVVVRDLTTGVTRSQGWPFAEAWPHGGQPPANGTANPGTPLPLESGHDYEIDVYLRARRGYVTGWVLPRTTGPEVQLALAVDPADWARGSLGWVTDSLQWDAPTLTVSPVTGNGASAAEVRWTPAPVSSQQWSGSGSSFVAGPLAPGAYRLTVGAARHDIQAPGGGPTGPTIEVQFPAWAPPGVLPETDPRSPGFAEPLTELYVGEFGASYRDPAGRLALELAYWDENLQAYAVAAANPPSGRTRRSDAIPIALVSPDTASGKLFFLPGGTPGLERFWDESPLPRGGYEFWVYLPDVRKWFRAHARGEGDETFRIRVGGGANNAQDSGPTTRYDLVVRAVSESDPTFRVPGTRLTVAGTGETIPMEGQTLRGYQGSPQGTVSHPQWEFVRSQLELLDPAGPVIQHTAVLRRGTAVRGRVAQTPTDAPLPDARVIVLDRFGHELRRMTNGPDGAFSFASALPAAEPLFVEVLADGFVPWRRRYEVSHATPEAAPNGGPSTATLLVDASLAPLAPPRFVRATVDRRGTFLPGVRRSGSERFYDGSRATNALTLHWEVEVQAEPVVVELPAFDRPDGSPGGIDHQEFPDEPLEVLCLDPRSFPEGLQGGGVAAVPLPGSEDPAEIRAWLRRIETGAITNVPLRRATLLAPLGENERWRASGPVPIWQLPTGDFDPRFVVRTRGGAVALRRESAFGAAADRLTGLGIPPWMASAADAMALIASVQNAPGQAGFWVEGRFSPLPTFTADIGVTNGFLLYRYGLGITWKEGMDTPQAGFLNLASRIAGIDFDAGLDFGLDGRERELRVRVAGAVCTTETNTLAGRALPKWAAARGTQISGSVCVAGESVQSASFSPGLPNEFELEEVVAGDVGYRAELNLEPVTARLPVIGPVFLALSEARLLEVFGTLHGGVGLRSTSHWRTVFPPAREDTTPDPSPQVLRRHFLGGTEGLPQRQDHLDLCFRFGAGLKVETFGGALGATAELSVEGHPCAGKPSTVVGLNPHADWPLFLNLRGNVTARASAHLDVWVARLGRTWEWPLVDFAHEFGTEPLFQWIPMRATRDLRLPADAAPVRFRSAGPTVLEDFLPTGSVAAAGPDCSLLFTDVEPVTGRMRLSITRVTDGERRTPAVITTAPGIWSPELLALEDGRWLAVWVEIEGDQLANPFPPTAIQYSLANAERTSWSPAARVASLPDAALQLRMVPLGAGAGLVFLHTADGPTATVRSAAASRWNGQGWSKPVDWLTDAPLDTIRAVPRAGGTTALARVVSRATGGEVRTWTWDGTQFSPPAGEVVLSESGAALALAADPAGGAVLVASHTGGGCRFVRFGAEPGPIEAPVDLLPDVHPSEIALAPSDDGPLHGWLIAWIAGGLPDVVRYSTWDRQGRSLEPNHTLDIGEPGPYRDLRWCVETAPARATILIRAGEDGSRLLALPAQPSRPRFVDLAREHGKTTVHLSGPAGHHRLQASTDLSTWTDLLPVLLLDNPRGTPTAVVVPEPGQESEGTPRFLRAVVGPRP